MDPLNRSFYSDSTAASIIATLLKKYPDLFPAFELVCESNKQQRLPNTCGAHAIGNILGLMTAFESMQFTNQSLQTVRDNLLVTEINLDDTPSLDLPHHNQETIKCLIEIMLSAEKHFSFDSPSIQPVSCDANHAIRRAMR